MIVRALDENHSWTYGRGKNDYLSNRAAVKQNIKTRLLSFYSDCFFALNDGIDWFSLLGSKNRLGLEVSISATILNTQDVTGITLVTSELDANRQLTITYKVDTAYGVVTDTFTPSQFLVTEDGDVIETEDGEGIII